MQIPQIIAQVARIQFDPGRIKSGTPKWCHLLSPRDVRKEDNLMKRQYRIGVSTLKLTPEAGDLRLVYGLHILPGKGSERSHHGFRDHSYCE